ncbi:nuclear transport factor 2 family protein [Chryseobacterium sp. Mn2064]|uniref:nuclear transport factor 2 family protein n=1 Tax=Chryseobacterium sp. Mn2064 TaxID=3395263 RepID=UPI003BEC51F1
MKRIISYGLLLFLVMGTTGTIKAQSSKTVSTNKELVRESFENWVSKTGSPFDLLADDVEWTITGSSKQSKTYTSKKQLINEVLNPLNERLSKRITPNVKGIYADGDMVIVWWKSDAITNAGESYNGEYAWFMKFENGKIIKVTAFLDNQKFAKTMLLPKNK